MPNAYVKEGNTSTQDVAACLLSEPNYMSIKKHFRNLLTLISGIDFKSHEEKELMFKVARFVACEMIEGDYIEFGVYQGSSLINSYHHLQRQFHDRINLRTGGANINEAASERTRLWNGMRFIAFDSFEGLPALSTEDRLSPDFQEGMYVCSEENFRHNVIKAGVPANKLYTVAGFFRDTCTDETRRNLGLIKAAVVWLDADLYSSTRDALNFTTPLLQDGTVLIFDDWFSFKGNPGLGVQKAFREWERTLRSQYIFTEYQRDSWKRMSFIASRPV